MYLLIYLYPRHYKTFNDIDNILKLINLKKKYDIGSSKGML